MSDREIELISKVPIAKNSGKLSKEEFDINLTKYYPTVLSLT